MKKRFLLFGCYFILNRLTWIAIWIFTNKKKNVTSVTAEKNPLIILGLSMVAFALVGGIIYVIKK